MSEQWHLPEEEDNDELPLEDHEMPTRRVEPLDADWLAETRVTQAVNASDSPDQPPADRSAEEPGADDPGGASPDTWAEAQQNAWAAAPETGTPGTDWTPAEDDPDVPELPPVPPSDDIDESASITQVMSSTVPAEDDSPLFPGSMPLDDDDNPSLSQLFDAMSGTRVAGAYAEADVPEVGTPAAADLPAVPPDPGPPDFAAPVPDDDLPQRQIQWDTLPPAPSGPTLTGNPLPTGGPLQPGSPVDDSSHQQPGSQWQPDDSFDPAPYSMTPPPARERRTPRKKRGRTARERRDSGLYLPWWSLLILLGGVILVAVVIILGLNFLGGQFTPGGETPVVIVITSTPTTAPTSPPSATPFALPTFTPTGVVAAGLPDAGTPLVETPGDSVITPAPELFEVRIGATIEVFDVGVAGLNVRQGAGTNFQVVYRAQDDEQFSVIGGPEEANGFTWWQIRSLDGSIEGWAVEDFLRVPQ